MVVSWRVQMLKSHKHFGKLLVYFTKKSLRFSIVDGNDGFCFSSL